MRSSRFRLPRPLPPGGTIGICSPSGPPDPVRVARGVARLEARGHRVKLAAHALSSHEYFSAPDETRVADFMALIDDPEVDMLMMSRGGYGLSRIVHRIDWQRVAASGKTLCGFSDFTVVNLALLARAGGISLAGPGVATDFGDQDGESEDDHAFMAAHFWPVARGEACRVEIESETEASPQRVEGPLWGSNLSLLTDLNATPFMPKIENGILFIEEIGEHPYVVERMLLQLLHAGVLAAQRAVLLANFTDCQPMEGRFPYSMSHVVATMRRMLPCPVLTGLPFGHVARKLTLPFGADAVVEISRTGYSLAY